MGSKRKAPADTRAHKVETRKTEIRADGAGLSRLPRAGLDALMLPAVLLIGLAVRLLPLTYCISGNSVLFSEFDPYYHMRRIVYTIDHFPFANSFDSYVNYPHGFGISWPPLFDLIAATLSLIAGLGNPARFTIELVSAAVPVLLGVLSIVLLYYIVKDALGKNAALIAAFFMAVLPAAIFRTAFAFTDHHALEIFMSLAMYLCFTRAITIAREEKLSLSNIGGSRKALLYSALAGLGIAGMIFSWDGAPIFISVLLAYAFVQYAYDAYSRRDSEYLSIVGAASALVSVALVTPLIMAGPAGQDFTISALYLSWFQIIYLIVVALFFVVMGGLTRLFSGLKAPWFSAVLTAILGVILLAAAASFALPQFSEAIDAGIKFLMGYGDVNTTIVEVDPLFINNGELSVDIPWAYFSTGGALAIIGFGIYLFNRRWRSLRNAEIFLLVWTLIIIALGLMQKRFVYVLAVNVAVFAGYAIYEALALAGFFGTVDVQKKASRAREGSITPPVVAVGIVAVVLLIPLLGNAVSMSSSPEPYTLDWNEACQWVSGNTPKTSYSYSADNGTHPEYGIMSWWDYGNFILYKAERPAIANNFQTGIADAAKFFIAQDEASANAIMDECSAKYVMLDYRLGSPWAGVTYGIFENMPYLAGDDVDSYHMSYLMPVQYGSKRMLDGSDKYYNSMYSRLFNGDGLGGRDQIGYNSSGLERYRLVYETQGGDPVKVFEYVKGAAINGTAAPGTKLELSLRVTTPSGAKVYHGSATADAKGTYSFLVPYPTSGTVGVIKTGPAYTVTSGASTVEVQVPESAIDNGDTIAGGPL
jgi:dolichyl-phosphooligosaccharide-protein glycotransferase